MRPERYLLIFAIFCLTFDNSSFSQDETSYQLHKCARLEGGIGMHFLSANYNNNIVPGADFHYCYGIKSGKKLGLGVGGGFIYFENETFVPFFLNALYFLSQSKYASFINVEAGYAMGWSKKYIEYHNANFSGGEYLGIGFGKKIFTNKQMPVYIGIKYNHQFAEAQYETDLHKQQNKSLHYNMVFINIGLMLED
jgi:hypothetical protein